MEVKKYQITKMSSGKGLNRIVNEIKKIDSVFNATIDRETKILVVECTPPEEKYKLDDYYKSLNNKILKAIRVFEKKANMESIDEKEIYRRVLYLNGLDCAYCGLRVETLAKQEFNHQRIVVDYPTYRFIIETTDKDLIDHIEERVSDIAHKVDERIVVQSAEKGKPIEQEISTKMKKPQVIIMLIGTLLLIVGIMVAYDFKAIFLQRNYSPIQGAQGYIGVSIIIAGYLLVGHQIIFRFIKNLFRGRIFDENFLMTIASVGAIITQHFPEAGLIMILYQLGEFLQNLAVNRSRKSIQELLSYEVQLVKVRLGEDITEIGVEGVLPDDVIIISKGEMIPVDGIVCKGRTILDTKNITGESKARQVNVNDEVLSGSLNLGSNIEIRVTRAYNNSMMTRILDMVENATINKSKSENFITRFCRYYTPIVVGIAGILLLVGIIGGFFHPGYEDYLSFFMHWLYVASEYLIISCPCALVISVPLAFFCGIGVASKRGILIRGSNFLEASANIENIVFDKTGTLTKGNFVITNVVTAPGYKPEEVKRLFLYTEYYSDHPIGRSLVDDAGRDGIFTEIIDDFHSMLGGARATINGSHIIVANRRLAIKEKLVFPEVFNPNLVIYVFKERIFIGYVVIGDSIREDAYPTINKLRKNGIDKVIMLTGDSKSIADNVANVLQIDEVYAELLPDEKVEYMDKIKESSKRKNSTTAYVGDGINDAPVIAASDVGIAMGDTASDATISISDIVIMSDDLNKLNELMKITRATKRKVIFNIAFSLTIKGLIAIVALLAHSEETQILSLWLAIFSDVGVSLLAILNSLTLLRLFGKQKKIDLGGSANDKEVS